jgi:hypothetical protein
LRDYAAAGKGVESANYHRMSQLELFAEPHVAISTVPTVEAIRARLHGILGTLRSATEAPWSAKEMARWRLMVPQMADWLPIEERDAVRTEFANLIGRFEAKAA